MPRVAIVGLLALTCAAGCWNWTVGGAPVDAAVGEEPSAPEAGLDAVVDHDAPAPVDSSLGAPDTSNHPDAATCESLAATIESDLGPALVCVTGQETCTSTVIDPCGCKHFVGNGASPAAVKYEADVTQFHDASCMASCGSQCPPAGPSVFCIPTSDGGLPFDVCMGS